MRRRWGYAVVLALVTLIYIAAERNRPVPLDMTVTLSRYDRIPYGTYILHEQLGNLFKTLPEDMRIRVSDLPNAYIRDAVLIVMAPSLLIPDRGVEEILDFASKGNSVFIASLYFPELLRDTLGFSHTIPYAEDAKNDTVMMRLLTAGGGNGKGYPMRLESGTGHFDGHDRRRTRVLGVGEDGKPNFLRVEVGEGYVYLHAAPKAFSNLEMLSGSNSRYAAHALSALPESPSALYWDLFYTAGGEGLPTPMRVILSRPSLRAAYYTALFAVLLFLVFQSKRRQRVIPVVAPLRNSTMDFVQTVSDLYLGRSDHRNIALKKISYFLEHVRQRYGMSTAMLDEAFADLLSRKAGYPAGETLRLTEAIARTRAVESVTEPELMSLTSMIDQFHQKTKT